MDSVEAAQELHSLKLSLIETEVTGLKKKVDTLETKDRDILRDVSKLDQTVNDLGISISKLTSLKVYDILAIVRSYTKLLINRYTF